MAIRRARERATGRLPDRKTGGGTLCRVQTRADGGVGSEIGLLALPALRGRSGVYTIPTAARATLSRIFAEAQRTMTLPRIALLAPLALAVLCAGAPRSIASESP